MTWEYRIRTVQGANDEALTALLNEQGGAEWELVGFDRVATADQDGEPQMPYAIRFIFKREMR